jgi:hypothetical protein
LTGGTLNNSGVQIGSGVTLTKFDGITWGSNFQTTGSTSDSLLNIAAQTATLNSHTFPASWTGGECTVCLNTSGEITMVGFAGDLAGDTNDCDSTNSRGGVTGTGVVNWASAGRNSGTLGSPWIF